MNCIWALAISCPQQVQADCECHTKDTSWGHSIKSQCDAYHKAFQSNRNSHVLLKVVTKLNLPFIFITVDKVQCKLGKMPIHIHTEGYILNSFVPNRHDW